MAINIYGYFMNFFPVLLNCMAPGSFEDVDYKNHFGEFELNTFTITFDIYHNLKTENYFFDIFYRLFCIKIYYLEV